MKISKNIIKRAVWLQLEGLLVLSIFCFVSVQPICSGSIQRLSWKTFCCELHCCRLLWKACTHGSWNSPLWQSERSDEAYRFRERHFRFKYKQVLTLSRNCPIFLHLKVLLNSETVEVWFKQTKINPKWTLIFLWMLNKVIKV